MNQHLHPIFQQALTPWMPPPRTYAELDELIDNLRDKITEEHRLGLDSVDDEGDAE